MKKRWAAGLLLLGLLLPVPVKAREPVDTAREVMLTVETEYGGKALENAEIHLYQVSEMGQGGELTPLPEFAAFSGQLDIRGENAGAWQKTAEKLEKHIRKKKIQPTAWGHSDSRGETFFGDIPQGLYLITGLRHRQGGVLYKSNASFVMLPGIDPQTEQWEYELTVHVKPEAAKKTGPTDAELPKTGMIFWPLPVMLSSGGMLLMLGIWHRRKRNIR